jgi:hypothetical protein
LSDFHEMATNLKFKQTRSVSFESPSYRIDNGGRRLGIERRQFDYSIFFPERRDGSDRRLIPERRIDPNLV